jgi:hypothetical protein
MGKIEPRFTANTTVMERHDWMSAMIYSKEYATELSPSVLLLSPRKLAAVGVVAVRANPVASKLPCILLRIDGAQTCSLHAFERELFSC